MLCQELYQFKKLRKLSLSNNRISKLSCDIGLLSSLQELDVSHNGMSFGGLGGTTGSASDLRSEGRGFDSR